MNRILVVDDKENIRGILAQMLSSMGYEVITASGGIEGLNLFLKSAFDLVLTDLEMPGMDGLTLALRIKDKSPHTPVVLITGSGNGAVMESLKESCVDSVMFKPFTLEDIQKTVQNILHT